MLMTQSMPAKVADRKDRQHAAGKAAGAVGGLHAPVVSWLRE